MCGKIITAIIFLTFFQAFFLTGKVAGQGLLLTFDDRNMLSWEKQIPLFAKYGAHVTFFVDHFDELSPEQISALQNLKNAGHSIGCHGLRHLKAAEYSEKYSTGKYISDEIIPAIQAMEKKGFRPTCFAYPNSNRNDETDKALKKYFRHIRSGSRVEGTMEATGKSFVKADSLANTFCFYGLSFHPKSKNDSLVVQAKKAIDRLAANREFLVLYAHDIRNEGEEGPKNYITVDALEEFLSVAAKNHVKMYSFDELP